MLFDMLNNICAFHVTYVMHRTDLCHFYCSISIPSTYSLLMKLFVLFQIFKREKLTSIILSMSNIMLMLMLVHDCHYIGLH